MPALSPAITQLVSEFSSDIILTLDAAGRVRTANPAALAELRTTIDALIGQPWLDLLDAGSHAKGCALLAAETPSAVYELNQVAGDQTIVLIGYRAIRLPPEHATDPEAPRVLLIGRPLSATIAATQRLVALNRRLDTLYTIVSVAARTLSLDAMLGEVLSLLLADLVAQAAVILLADAPIAIAPTQATPHPSAFHLAAQRGLMPDSAERLRELPALLPERFDPNAPTVIFTDELPAEVAWLELQAPTGPLTTMLAAPIHSDRQLLGWLCVIADRYQAFGADVTDLVGSVGASLGPPIEKARLYDELIKTTGQLSAVLDSIDSGVLLIDTNGVIRYANQRLGVLLDTNVADWPGRLRTDRLADLIRPLDESVPLFEEPLLLTTSAPPRILRRFSDQIGDLGGASAGIIEVYSDVTHIHEMNRLRDEFIAAAAHDLKTPVTAVKGYTQIALRLAQRLNEPRLIGPLEMINARSNDLAYLMDTLLDMSRIQAGRLRLELDEATLQDLVARALRHFALDLQRQGRAIAVEQPGEPITVRWDALRIERVLINLVGNALKYSPDGGDVQVAVRQPPGADEIELTVTDFGIGIPPEERAQIFDRFYRARQALAEGFKGSGLGLYICRSLVAAHGGQIWAAGALHGGRGTTIYIRLPRYVERDEPEQI
jgi:two-component system phosphate regulon sensor histidine kinase PhoR